MQKEVELEDHHLEDVNSKNSFPQKNLEKEQREKEKIEKEIEEQKRKFQDGQLLTFVRVRFPGNAKSFPFLLGKRNLAYGQKVVAQSDRGMAVGYINSFPYELPFSDSLLPIKYISKIATQEDFDRENELISREKSAEEICLRHVENNNLDMNLTHVEFTQFGKKCVFYFTAPGRVDFRNLVKGLVNDLKMRIELRQISVRDRSAAIGGIGPCGRQLCCSSFLQQYGNVSIKMAKNQNLTLVATKLNGVCGQLKCCIQYEDDVYSHKRSLLPTEDRIIVAKNGDIGKVIRLHILQEQFDLLTDRGVKRRYALSMYDKSQNVPEHFRFPERFQHVTDETSQIIGQEVKKEKPAYSDSDDSFFMNKETTHSLDDNFDMQALQNDKMISTQDMLILNQTSIQEIDQDDDQDQDEKKDQASNEHLNFNQSKTHQQSQGQIADKRDHESSQKNNHRHSSKNRNNRNKKSKGPSQNRPSGTNPSQPQSQQRHSGHQGSVQNNGPQTHKKPFTYKKRNET